MYRGRGRDESAEQLPETEYGAEKSKGYLGEGSEIASNGYEYDPIRGKSDGQAGVRFLLSFIWWAGASKLKIGIQIGLA